MLTRSEFLRYLIGYGAYLPVVVIWIVGIILSLIRWKRHPRISMLALLGLAGFMIMFVFNLVINIWASHTFYGNENAWTASQIETFYNVKGVITALIEAGFWVMLIYAIFAMRGEQSRPAQANYGQPAPPTASA